MLYLVFAMLGAAFLYYVAGRSAPPFFRSLPAFLSGVPAGVLAAFLQALLQARAARHKTLAQTGGGVPSFYSFPVALASSANDARQYAAKQGIRTGAAFADSVAALLGDGLEGCRNARSLLLRCLLFPLYPRLGSKNVEKIAKVLRSLP